VPAHRAVKGGEVDRTQDSRDPKQLAAKNDCAYTPGLPSIDVVRVVEDFTLEPVPSEYAKAGRDWVVLYNPKVEKTLDLNLVHTFEHAGCVIIAKTPLLFLNFLEQRDLFCPFLSRWPIFSNWV
jgi:hypothetical protein